jgi:simple sugar transport system ATP-binding protein
MKPALELIGICKQFDGFQAISSADFTVLRGEVHALLGENGAGKSSLMNVAAGLYAADEGRILVDGADAQIGGPLDAMRLGIGMVHQHFKLVKAFNAVENIMLGRRNGKFSDLLLSIEGAAGRIAESLNFAIDLKRPVGLLSIAEQQRIEVIKVLMSGARILILDEPTSVLTDNEAESLLSTMRRLAKEGTAVVLVTHKLREVKKYADKITVMRSGKTIVTANATAMSSQELTVLVVGEPLREGRIPPAAIGPPLLLLKGICAARTDGHRTLNGVTITVRRGEIYGIAGVGGNGQSELAEALMGVRPVLEGSIEVAGIGDLTHAPAFLRRSLGLVSIPADRQSYGLASELSIADNYAVGGVVGGRFGGFFRIDGAAVRDATRQAVEMYGLQGVRNVRQRTALLSGGNAQKLVIAREFASSPKVILAHSPSRGLDVRATAAVHEALRKARDSGAAVLLLSEDLDEILLLSDKIGVMNRGKITAEFTYPVDRQFVGQAMVDHD